MLKLALINVHAERYRASQTIGATNIAYLAAHIREAVDETDIRLDVHSGRLLAQFQPDLIGLSSTTENYALTLKDIHMIRERWPQIPIVIGGPHISALPQSLPPLPNLVGVMGEGEDSFLEIIQGFLQNGQLLPERIQHIPSLVFYAQDGSLIQTPPRQLDQDIDRFPMPARDLLLTIPERHQPALLTSRGCPFRCSFCSTRMLWKDIRFHSPERVIQELYNILKLFPDDRSIRIDDDLFTLNFSRLRKISQAIREEGLHKQLMFTCSARANTLSDKVCKVLRDMNVRNIFLGLESGSTHVLRHLKGPIIHAKHNQEALALCQKYDFWVSGSFIVGSPEETKSDLHQTYWFIRQHFDRFGKVNICYATPYPDTPMWKQALETGLLPPDFKDWDALNLFYEPDRSVFFNTHYSKETFNEIYQQFMTMMQEKWFEIPRMAPQQLVYQKYMGDTYQQIRNHLRDSIQHILEIGTIVSRFDDFLPENITVFSVVPESGKLPHIEGIYDTIIVNHTLEYLRKPLQALIELKQHLSSQGQLFVTAYNAFHISHFAEILLGRWQPVSYGIYQQNHLQFFTHQTLEKLFNQAALHIESVFPVSQPFKELPSALEKSLTLINQSIPFDEQKLSISSYLFQLVPSPELAQDNMLSSHSSSE